MDKRADSEFTVVNALFNRSGFQYSLVNSLFSHRYPQLVSEGSFSLSIRFFSFDNIDMSDINRRMLKTGHQTSIHTIC